MNTPNVWITGASSGIGAALVREYANRGAQVFLTGRKPEALDKVRVESGFPQRCHSVPADVTDSRALGRAIEHIEQTFGAIDVAVLNAGTYEQSGVDDFSSAAMRKLFEINVFAVAETIELLLPGWRKRRSGSFVIVGSVAGDFGLPYAATYSAGKAALRRLSESLYPELKRDGISLHLVSPGFVDTPLTAKNDFPMPFMVSAERAAYEICRGVDKRKFEIRFPWRMSVAMRILRALPYPLQFSLARRMLK